MSTNTPIASQTLSSAASSVTFTGIPQNFTDLVIVISPTLTVTEDLHMRFNGDTGSDYSFTALSGSGSAAFSARASTQTLLRYSYITDAPTAGGTQSIININNYSNTTTNKTILIRTGAAADGVEAIVGLWRDTSAINQITLFLSGSGQYNTGSTFNLYGIASGSAKAIGGTVTTDGTYFYHTFTSSGYFTPSTALTADYLVVAGGGGGGVNSAGGGGAGGLRSTVTATGGGGSLETALSLTAQAYTVIVGAGGAGGVGPGAFASAPGVSGSNSVFSTITSIGGGNGGDSTANNANTGGSGGGNGTGISPAKAGTANQGFAGGLGASTGPGGAGGAGVAVSISGSSVTYAGGGGGSGDSRGSSGGFGGGGGGAGAVGQTAPNSGTAGAGAGGSGGGGAGSAATSTNGTSGTANTGGGGGGAAASTTAQGNGGNGGSGIVIVRYAV